MKLKIVTDSTSDIPADLLQEHDITVIPVNVIDGDVQYKDGIEIQPDQLLAQMRDDKKFFKTSQPSPGDFQEALEPLIAEYDHVLVITLAKKLSGTYQSAMIALDFVDADKVDVYDSNHTTGGLGLIVVRAAVMAKEGKSLADILKVCEAMTEITQTGGYVDDLEYLRRGGRIGGVKQLLGKIFNLKPVIKLVDGELQPIASARGREKAQLALTEHYSEVLGAKREIDVFVTHALSEAEVDPMLAILKEHLKVRNVYISTLGAALGCHLGPGTLVVGVCPVDVMG